MRTFPTRVVAEILTTCGAELKAGFTRARNDLDTGMTGVVIFPQPLYRPSMALLDREFRMRRADHYPSAYDH